VNRPDFVALDHKRALDDNDSESYRNLPSFEERTALRPKILTEASKTRVRPSAPGITSSSQG
jgi:hypothetical protein